ncbi:MAG: SipW-dependent-type signal peptide-containing protein [Candidatus Levybacteria bacterium]|nr:SipW-dependent-type signal peptide-containing protein [Candidatus Levybacteria bacterium]
MLTTRIGISMFSILAAVGLLSGATFAFFTDTATSQDNTFATGTADLQIAVDNAGVPGAFGAEITAPAIDEENIVPGFSKTYDFWLRNNSSTGIDMSIAAALADIITTGNAGIQDQLTVQIDCGIIAGPAAVSGFTGGPYPVRATLSAGVNVPCEMTVSLPSSVDSSYQASSVRFDGVFTGTQL